MLSITTSIASYNNYFWAHLNEYMDDKSAQKHNVLTCMLGCGNSYTLTVILEAAV
jgi:hypothetical protein